MTICGLVCRLVHVFLSFSLRPLTKKQRKCRRGFNFWMGNWLMVVKVYSSTYVSICTPFRPLVHKHFACFAEDLLFFEQFMGIRPSFALTWLAAVPIVKGSGIEPWAILSVDMKEDFMIRWRVPIHVFILLIFLAIEAESEGKSCLFVFWTLVRVLFGILESRF